MKVVIFENKGATQEKVVEVVFENDRISFIGDQSFISRLEQEGIRDYGAKVKDAKVYPVDGVSFIQNLVPFFSSGNMSAKVV